MLTFDSILLEYFVNRLDGGVHFDITNFDDLNQFESFLIKRDYLKHFDHVKLNELLENCIVEGNYPERQAYNVNGLLVTFPTPEYKQKAIARGTHFEENPKKDQQAASVNIFDKEPKLEPQVAPKEEPSSVQPSSVQPDSVSTDVKSDTSTVEPDEKDEPESDPRTPQEKQQDAQVVQKILTTEYSLEEALSNNFYYKKGTWYTSDGEIVGKSRYIENLGKVLIIGKK